MMEEFHKNLPAAVNIKPTVSEEESTAYEPPTFSKPSASQKEG